MDLRYRAALGNNPAEVAPVRRAVSRVASMVGFVSRADDVELALSEILANAQEHGRVPITVSAWFDGRFLVEVRDHGKGFDRTRIWASHPPTPLGLRGRGLWITRQITDGVTVRPDGGRVAAGGWSPRLRSGGPGRTRR